MRRTKAQPLRVKLDMTDVRQVRIIKKRLGISESDLARIVEKIGNSISAISKEVATQRARQLSPPAQVPNAAIITSVSSVPAGAAEAQADQSSGQLPAPARHR